MLDEVSFYRYMIQELGLPESDVRSSTLLVEELGLDSIQILELIVIIEDLGVIVPDDPFPELRSAGDAFALWRDLNASAAVDEVAQ